ncbi:MAG: ABC transporter ATP-binding protein [Candidatus Bathyarchaeia archaeon]
MRLVVEKLKRMDGSTRASQAESILRVRGLTVEFRVRRGTLLAVDDLDLDVQRGEVLGLVGESGCGKSVLAHSILRLTDPNEILKSGKIFFEDRDVLSFDKKELRDYRWKDVSIVFQGALNSLNPVLKIMDHMSDTVSAHEKASKTEILDRSSSLLEMVRLDAEALMGRYPHELSGGMKQRVISGMAMLLEPKLLILDEPTSSLDMLTQKFFVKLLAGIRKKMGLTMIFITHDLATVAEIADRVAIMYSGDIVELGEVNEIFYRPIHPYTRALIDSVPSVVGDIERFKPIPGPIPDPVNLPPACRFHPRCPYRMDICSEVRPKHDRLESGGIVACHRWRKIK